VVADRLTGVVRQHDAVARLGGDEFAILVRSTTLVEARQLAGRICASIALPVELEGQIITIGTSIGVVLVPDHGTDPGQLLRSADAAMYEAKRGKLGFVVHASRAPSVEVGDGGELPGGVQTSTQNGKP
jgi:diguanylate cyclase (GGDEF)-like protein